MMMPQGMPMDPAMGGGMPPMDPAMGGGMPPMDPAMGGGMPPMDMLPPEGEAPMEDMGDALADEGRQGDAIVGHLTPGEIVIPLELANNLEVLETLEDLFADNQVSIDQYTVGHEANSINPETGMPEFYSGYQGQTYWGRTGGSTPASFDFVAPTQQDYDRFNIYMTNYKANREIEEQKIKEYTDYLEERNTHQWMIRYVNDPEGTKAYEDKMKSYGALYGETVRNRRQIAATAGQLHRPDWQKQQNPMNLGEGNIFRYLSPYQRQGAWQHGERLQDTWSSLSESQKKKEFEDFFQQLNTTRSFYGSTTGAGAGYGTGKGDPYKSDSQVRREKQLEEDLAAQEEAFLAQLRAEEARQKAAAKRQAAINARVARMGGKGQAASLSVGAMDAAGGETDPRSMVARSYARRSSGGGGLSIGGFNPRLARPS
tara:strand:- start:5021 stop:6304 length:1284 start_codon:yes stop_codon:yes gene_type:complete